MKRRAQNHMARNLAAGVLGATAIVGALFALRSSWPELRRYLRIRGM